MPVFSKKTINDDNTGSLPVNLEAFQEYVGMREEGAPYHELQRPDALNFKLPILE